MPSPAIVWLALLAVLPIAAGLLNGHRHESNLRVTDPAAQTALDEYIGKLDFHYKWNETGEVLVGIGYTVHMVHLTSQQWLSPLKTSRSVWTHQLAVIVPDKRVFNKQAVLYITGGSNKSPWPVLTDEDIELAAAIAVTTGAVALALFQVPNEDMVFYEDPHLQVRGEDAIIAWTWYHFQKNPKDAEWLLRLPMTKAVVRAMDCATEFLEKKYRIRVEEFLVAGASKRGWTTWTTAAVDKRVVAMAPIVMDLLNMVNNSHHMFRNLGGWTFAFKDYYALNFTQNLDTPETQLMANIIDPYVYRERYTMPKLVIDAGGDEFFQPDDNLYWWDDMPGDKHLLMIQNAEHSMATGVTEIVQSISAFVGAVFTDTPCPAMTWNLTRTATGGTITVSTSEEPVKLFVRWTDTLDGHRRDFRLVSGDSPCVKPRIPEKGLCFQPILWKTENATKTGPKQYTASFKNPEIGWRAFFIEAKFQNNAGGPLPFIFTTQVNIIPEHFPFPDCHGKDCLGTLV